MLGIIANPASGKDIRRLISGASVFDNQEKRNIVRRAVLGALAAGERSFRYVPDGHGIARSAIEDAAPGCDVAPVDIPLTDSALDTARGAERMQDAGCGAVIVLGGDGTNRAAALGWQDIPVIAVSTGTNNVFPSMIEGTLAGIAGGLVGCGRIRLDQVVRQAKAVHLEIEGERDDLALIDAALIRGPFLGARAVWEPSSLKAALLTRAEPASVGLSSIGAFLSPLPEARDAALYFETGDGGVSVTAPIAPGLIARVLVRSHRRLELGEAVAFEGPGVLALDGERERRLRPGQHVRAEVRRDGPRVIDVAKALAVAACNGLFVEGGTDGR